MAELAIAIAGSPRRNGNSTTLLKEALKATEESGLRTELIHLNDLSYRGCQACMGCEKTGQCVTKDDMSGIYEKLLEAKVWIFASPIYFCSVSGQMKTFFDRLYCWAQPAFKLPGTRRGAFIVTYEAKESDFYAEVARRLVRYFKWFGDFEVTEVFAAPRLGAADAAKNKPELLEQARALGRKLCEGLA